MLEHVPSEIPHLGKIGKYISYAFGKIIKPKKINNENPTVL